MITCSVHCRLLTLSISTNASVDWSFSQTHPAFCFFWFWSQQKRVWRLERRSGSGCGGPVLSCAADDCNLAIERESAELAKPACLRKVEAFPRHWQMSYISGCCSLPFCSAAVKPRIQGGELWGLKRTVPHKKYHYWFNFLTFCRLIATNFNVFY